MATTRTVALAFADWNDIDLRNRPEPELIKNTVAIWARLFASTPDDAFSRAAAIVTNEHDFWPTPATFRRLLPGVTIVESQADTAFGVLTDALNRPHDEREAFAGPALWSILDRTVHALGGWRALSTLEYHQYLRLRPDFIRVFSALERPHLNAAKAIAYSDQAIVVRERR